MKDVKQIFREVSERKPRDRKTAGLYVSQAVMKKFRKLCKKVGDVSPSEVVEAWMREANDGQLELSGK